MRRLSLLLAALVVAPAALAQPAGSARFVRYAPVADDLQVLSISGKAGAYTFQIYGSDRPEAVLSSGGELLIRSAADGRFQVRIEADGPVAAIDGQNSVFVSRHNVAVLTPRANDLAATDGVTSHRVVVLACSSGEMAGACSRWTDVPFKGGGDDLDLLIVNDPDRNKPGDDG